MTKDENSFLSISPIGPRPQASPFTASVSRLPWQNGIAERTGGTLKAITHALVKAIGEAVAAYNSDINEEGVTPFAVRYRAPTS